jgi:DNA helicase-2/ATP-dependent DNA helicase PcrA
MVAAGLPEARAALPAKARAGLEQFAAAIAAVGGALAYPVEPAVRKLIEASGLLARFEKAGEDERVENLKELAAAAGEYDFTNPDGSLAGFLEQVALVADIDAWDDKAERVSLMTLHSAKGLEFPAVFVTGLEEGLLPHVRSLGESGGAEVEEERRLLYVGMTRAREELVLSWARSRRRFGPSQPAVPSRFVGELPADQIHPPGAVARALERAAEAAVREWEQPVRRMRPRREERSGPRTDADGRYFDEEAALEAARSEELGLSVGDLVEHPRFGRGRVEAIEGLGATARITVAFSGYGRKKLIAAYAGLQKADS